MTCHRAAPSLAGAVIFLQRGDGLLRVELLVKADDGVEDDDGEDGDGVGTPRACR